MKFIVIRKPQKYNIIISFLILLIIFYILYNSNFISSTIKTNINLFLYSLLPAIFIPIFLTNILIESNLIYSLSFGLSKFASKIFKIPISSCPAIIIGMMLGYPNSAKFLSNMHSNNLVNKKQCNKLISFTSNASPAYIVSTIGLAFYKSIKLGLILLASHILSSLVLGILLRLSSKDIIQQTEKKEYIIYKKKFGFDTILNSIFSTLKTLGLIFTFMIIFSIVSSIICNSLKLNPICSAIITGLFEITNGLSLLSNCSMSLPLQIILSSFILSFGSLMILYQVYAVSYTCHISFKNLVINKIKHGILSAIITYILLKLFNITNETTSVFSNFNNSFLGNDLGAFKFNVILTACIFIIFICFNIKQKKTAKY